MKTLVMICLVFITQATSAATISLYAGEKSGQKFEIVANEVSSQESGLKYDTIQVLVWDRAYRVSGEVEFLTPIFQAACAHTPFKNVALSETAARWLENTAVIGADHISVYKNEDVIDSFSCVE